MKKAEDVLTFAFEEIDLSQIQKLVPGSRSKYADLRQQIVAHIQTLANGKTFIFAPDKNQKMDEKQIQSIQSGVNNSLAKEDLNYKIKYSQVASAFVVIPTKRKYRKVATIASDDTTEKLNLLTGLIQKHYNIPVEELKNPTFLSKSTGVRQVFVWVAKDVLGVPTGHLSGFFDRPPSTISTIYKRAKKNPNAQDKMKFLTAELKGK